MPSRWAKTQVGKLGEPWADELYGIIADWTRRYCNNGAVHPTDVATIAKAVIEKIAEDEGLYIAANRRAFEKPQPSTLEYEDCGSCRGRGHFAANGKASIDRRDRKCLDCRGEGRVPKKASPKTKKPRAPRKPRPVQEDSWLKAVADGRFRKSLRES